MSAATLTRPAAAASRLDRPMPHFVRAVVSQNEAGDWLCNGVVQTCSLGGHEGKARARAEVHDVSRLLEAATPADRNRMLACAIIGFSSVEELWAMETPPGRGRS